MIQQTLLMLEASPKDWIDNSTIDSNSILQYIVLTVSIFGQPTGNKYTDTYFERKMFQECNFN